MALTPILADVDVGTLARSLAVAVVIVLPYGLVLLRRARARQRDRLARSAPVEVMPSGPTLEDVIDSIAALDPATGGTVELPDGCTIDGQPVDPGVVALVLADAFARSGLEEVGRSTTPSGIVIRCAPAEHLATDRGADDGDAVRP